MVDHPLLLQKLELLGFDNHAAMWMWSYLTGRSQSVYVDGKISEFQEVLVGVHQGSVLVALLDMIQCKVDKVVPKVYSIHTVLSVEVCAAMWMTQHTPFQVLTQQR